MINELPTILKIALRPLKNKLRFDYLKNNFRKIRANIIHAHFAHVGWEAIKLKDALKLPLVVSFMDTIISQFLLSILFGKNDTRPCLKKLI